MIHFKQYIQTKWKQWVCGRSEEGHKVKRLETVPALNFETDNTGKAYIYTCTKCSKKITEYKMDPTANDYFWV